MKTRRGLSSVIGTVFAIVALATTITYITYSMNLLEQFNQTIFTKTVDVIDRGNEEFKVTQVSIVNDKFNITVQNTGNIPIHITRLWAENKTTIGSVFKYDIDAAVSPGRTITNVGQNIQLTAFTTKAYQIKLVTERGNTKEFSVNSANLEPIHLQLFALPKTVSNGFTTTLLFAVTNNMSNDGVLTNLKPKISHDDSLGASAAQLNPDPAAYPLLEKGDTAYFEYTFKMSGKDGQSSKFEAWLDNGFPGNSVVADVSINDVEFAQKSDTSLTSLGLSAIAVTDDILFLHQETEDTPAGGRQMYSVGPDKDVGQIIQLDAISSAVFYTNNETLASPINIPSGTWNASLRYFSNPVPDSLIGDGESMIFHFNNVTTTAKDSTINANDLTLGPAPNNNPTCQNIYGKDGTGACLFSGNQYMDRNINSYMDIENQASTAGWFKTGSLSQQTILRMGNNGDGQSFYEVGLDAGKVVFRYSIKNGAIDTCQTPLGIYADNNWHHFAAVKTGSGTCDLYVDTLPLNSDPTVCTGSCNTHPSGKFVIGRDSSSPPSKYFSGYIEDVMHWDSYALSQAEINDLYYASYGNGAHKVSFVAKIVDKFGNDLDLPLPALQLHTIFTSTDYPLPFVDSFGKYASPTDAGWGHQNFTMNAGSYDIQSDERLKFEMTFTHPPLNVGELDMKMIIDDDDIIDADGNSFLQIPFPSEPLPGYYTYDNCCEGTVYIYNSGKNGAWLTYNSRIAFETLDGSQAYGAWVTGFDVHPFSSSEDSEYIAPGNTLQITFSIPSTHPGTGVPSPDPVVIPVDRYKMYVFLNGYDQTGSVFFGTQYIGVVKVK